MEWTYSWKTLAKSADRVFYFEGGPRDTQRLTAKIWLKIGDQKTWAVFSLFGLEEVAEQSLQLVSSLLAASF
jgi:hypothetical protein